MGSKKGQYIPIRVLTGGSFGRDAFDSDAKLGLTGALQSLVLSRGSVSAFHGIEIRISALTTACRLVGFFNDARCSQGHKHRHVTRFQQKNCKVSRL